MSPVEWYYARNNKQMGPVSSLELKRLAAAGELAAGDLVWREGMAEWAAARNVRGLFDEEGRGAAVAMADPTSVTAGDSALKVGDLPVKSQNTPPASGPLTAKTPPARHLVDVVLDKFRPYFNAHFVETTAAVFRACGSYGLFVAAAAIAVFALIAATKISPLESLVLGAIGILTLLALQYVAGKSCDAIDEINRNTASRLSSPLLPNSLAVLSIVAGVAVLLGSVALAVEASQYTLILLGVAAFFVCAYLAVVALNPATLNISLAPEALPGEEAIGAFMFLLKALLRLTPVAFGVGVLYGTVLIAVACYEVFVDETVVLRLSALLTSATLPLAAYLLFLLGNLLLALWRSVLSLPVKLDKLTAKDESEGNTR